MAKKLLTVPVTDQELELLETYCQKNNRTKTDTIREYLRSLDRVVGKEPQDEITALREQLEELEQEKADLELLLETTADHSSLMEAELQDEAEEARRESEERFRAIAEATPVTVLLSQLEDGKIVYANATASATFGLSIEEILTSQLEDFYHDPNELAKLLVTFQEEGTIQSYELQTKKADGTTFWVTASLRPLNYNGLPVIVTALSDITALKQANDELQRLDKLKDEFLANTSHELRTPLNGIIGLAESLIDGATGYLPEATRNNLSTIVSSGRRLATLVNDILDFSKLRHNSLELKLKPLDLRSVTEVVLTLNKPLVANKPLQLINAINQEIPSAAADENRLQQIFYNLVGNAIKFTAAGQVTVSASVVQTEDTEQIAITVSDTGIGIPEDKIPTIFQSFEQADGSTAREFGGTGLGLAITKKLVELHGGEITVTSVPEQGSQFTFTLPVARNLAWGEQGKILTGDNVPHQPLTIINSHTPQANSLNNPHRFRILMVDDEPINIQVLINYLSGESYAITPANSGMEALKILETYQPDLILLDVMMPKMTGYEVCTRIRENFPANELPILMLTAKNQVEDLVTGLNSGANDYLTKPVSKPELLARIKTHLQLAKINLAYARFVPHQFLQFLDKESIVDVKLGDEIQKNMSILFADIRDFTSISETMNPEDNFKFINAYLSRMEPAIIENNGFIDKYIGDAIMALFSGGADDAVKAAISMLERLKEYNRTRGREERPILRIGIGINTGSLMLGTVGGKSRMDSTVISDAVNLASRLENLTKTYGATLLISQETFSQLQAPDDYGIRTIDKVKVRGKSNLITIYEVFACDPPAVREGKLETKTIFEEACLLYNQQDCKRAAKLFKDCLLINPGDRVARAYLERCRNGGAASMQEDREI